MPKSQSRFKVGETVIFQGVKVVIQRFINQCVALVRDWDNPKSKSFEVVLVHLSSVA